MLKSAKQADRVEAFISLFGGVWDVFVYDAQGNELCTIALPGEWSRPQVLAELRKLYPHASKITALEG